MHTICRSPRLPVVLCLSVLALGCQQSDQELPFALADGESASSQIGAAGGVVSLPPSFSLDIPANALSGTVGVEVSRLISGGFPSSGGLAVPGTAYDLQPAGTALSEPARVELKVDVDQLGEGELALLSVGVQRPDGSVATYGGTFDLTNGVLTAEIDELGPVAAVITADAIALSTEIPPELPGGSFPLPPPAPAPATGPVGADGIGVTFESSCAPDARQCFSSGIIRMWADEVVQSRLGEDVFLLRPEVTASLDFRAYDATGVPTEVVGSVSVDGELRASFSSTVASYALEEDVSTGTGGEPAPTTLAVEGNAMVIGATASSSGGVEFNETIEFSITGIGTSEMLVIEVDAELEFDNEDGSTEFGYVTAHVRLRR